MGFGKDGKGVILHEVTEITLLALASAAALKADTNIVLQDDFRLIKTEYFAFFDIQNSPSEELLIGIADKELSAAEIAQNINVTGPVDRNDNLANEQAMRPVWLISALVGSQVPFLANDYLPVEKTIRWTFSDTEGFTFFAYNPRAGAMTTGSVIRIVAKHYGVWLS